MSLHHDGHLRGCIGTLLADHPLHQTVAQMAVSAAFDDPRFIPLSLLEMSALAIEISQRHYYKLLEGALSGEGDFAALGMAEPVKGAVALAQLANSTL